MDPIEFILVIIELLLIVALILMMLLLVVLINEFIKTRKQNPEGKEEQENGSVQTVHPEREE